MNLVSNQGVKSTSMAGSTVSWKSGGGDVVPDQFPAGLRVLVVDDDHACLMILEKMLRNCLYQATTCKRAEVALSLLRENKNGFDIVISNVHLPDMDGFKLLERIVLEMDLPVIMMSADDSKSTVMKGVIHGACDYLIKPVRIEALRNIWQHVVRKRKHECKDFEVSGSVEDVDGQQKTTTEKAEYSSSANERSCKSSSKTRKDDEDEGEVRDDSSSLKNPRVVWSVELHRQFVAAVNLLGTDKAAPKKILELMNVPGLSREYVASHLQTFLSHPPLASTHNKHLLHKYRLYLKRLSGSQHQGGLNSPFMGSPDPSFASMNGLDLQSLAPSGQIQPQSLANFQALGPGSKSHVSIPIDQKNLFNFEIPKFRFGEGHPQLSNNISHMSRQAMLPNGILARNGLGDNVGETGYKLVSQCSSIVDFSMNQNNELSPNGFPNISSKGGLGENVKSGGKVANERSSKSSFKTRNDTDEGDERDDLSSLKKPRVVWSVELHQKFIAAVNQLGIDKAVPEKILELMNVPGLKREHVASHLQKYRLYLRRLSGSQHQGGLNSPVMGSPDPSLASMNGLNSSKHMNLLHGIPTNMEPKQLANLHQAMLPNGILARNELGDNIRETGHNLVSQSSSIVDFSMNQNHELSPNGFLNISSKGGLGENVKSGGKVASGIIPSYDIYLIFILKVLLFSGWAILFFVCLHELLSDYLFD